MAVITIFYSLPLYKTKKSIFRLREIACLKIFLISFVWSASTILLPIIQSANHFNKNHVLAMLAERFLFVFAITIPFDIRDMQADAKEKLLTIPLLLGKKNAMVLANILLILFAVVCLWHYGYHASMWLVLAFLLSALSTLFFVNNKKLQSGYLYHYGILDGTLFLQGALVLICYSLKIIFP